MSFRTALKDVSVSWLRGTVAGGLVYSIGLMVDVLSRWTEEGVKASMPGVGNISTGVTDALYLIGLDHGIDRGPTETDAHYIVSLRESVDYHRRQGHPDILLNRLAAWFSPGVSTPLRLVTNRAMWHSINPSTLVVTRTKVSPTNWNWDGLTRWFRGWVIVDSTVAPWTDDGLWGSAGYWGDGGVWHCSATVSEIAQLYRLIQKWKPANVAARLVVTYSSTLYLPTDASPPNPSGTSDTAAWQLTQNAAFGGYVT